MKGARKLARRRSGWLALGLAVSALGFAGCGDDEDEGATSAATDRTAATTSPARNDVRLLIKTHVLFPEGGTVTGKVLAGSTLGGEPFCVGGTFRDGHGGSEDAGSVLRTMRCPGGSVKMGFTPHEPVNNVQRGPFTLVSGTGRYKGLRGKGSVKVTFASETSADGRETFTGTVTR